MSYYVYITDECSDDIRRHSMRDQVDRLRDKVEAEQTIVGFDRFPQPFLKKKFGKMRLVLEERILTEDVTVICFVRLVYRGDKAYDPSFLDDPQSIKLTYQVGDLERFVRTRQAQAPLPSNALSPIDDAYLHAFNRSPLGEGIVYESLDWVERVQDATRRSYLAAYGELVEDIINHPEGEMPLRKHARYPEVSILFRQFPALQRTVLLAPTRSGEDEETMRAKYARILTAPDDLPETELLRISRRSYPALIVIDRDIWMSTQASAEANLALSPEETSVLDSVRHGDAGFAASRLQAFPLFINGRPGSGKSTVLQYLFADLLFFHLTRPAGERFDAPPLYLTYSPSLLKQARSVVESILRCDAQKQLDGLRLDGAALQSTLDASFGNFRDFLRSLLPSENKARFDDKSYLDFPRFRGLFTEHFRKLPDKKLRDAGPEISWHVIRSYIKGMRDESEDFFDPESYAEHPSKRQTVEQGTFTLVYEGVFEKWYRKLCEVQGYWDDQDLTREVLRGGVDLARHPAVFCDEAQDFTNLELEFIYHLSRYSRRSVPQHLLNRVPFAFAGDPFQTLNPTGFSWNSVQADYHEKIAANIDRNATQTLTFNFKELAFNYRSAEAIVKLCNSIQLVRGIAFETKGLAPQKTWFMESAAIPVYFRDDDLIGRTNLQRHEEVVIIVPCHEGGEEDYVRSDPFLASFALLDEKLSRNIFSPMRAKGLEFSRVVLYNFGKEAISTSAVRDLLDPQESRNNMSSPREAGLPAEYFFNRLYVGASRARNRLIVIDSEDGLASFWSIFSKSGSATDLLERYQRLYAKSDSCVWSVDDLGRLSPGTAESWSEDRDNPLDLAKNFLAQGRAQRDPYFLDRARHLFVRAGEADSAEECRALGLEFSGKLVDAGLSYKALRKFDQAVRCLWEAGEYAEIDSLRNEPTLQGAPELAAARFMAGSRDAIASDLFLGELYALAQNPTSRVTLLLHPRWASVFGALVESTGAAAVATGVHFGANDWKRIFGQVLFCRTDAGLSIAPTLALAQLGYRAGEMRFAVDTVSTLPPLKERPRWLIEALATVEPFPANLEHLAVLGRHSEIIAFYDHNKNSRLSADVARTVKTAFRKEGRAAEALVLYEKFRSREEISSLLVGDHSLSVSPIAQRLAEILVEILVEEAEWKEAVELCASGKLQGRRAVEGAPLRMIDLGRLRLPFIRALAGSEKLGKEPRREVKKIVSDFLKGFIVEAKSPSELGLTAHEAAAAIERAGFITDALAFYEGIFERKWGDDPELARFARERWLLNKQRQLSVVEETRKGQVQRELRVGMERWQVSEERLSSLNQYPDHRKEATLKDPVRALPDAPRDGLHATARIAEQSATPTGGLSKVLASLPAEAPSTLTVLDGPTAPSVEKVVPAQDASPPQTEGGASQSTSPVRPRPTEVSMKFAVGSHSITGLVIAKARKLELRDLESADLLVISGSRQSVTSHDLDVVIEPGTDGVIRWRVPQWNLGVALRSAGPTVLIELTSADEQFPIIGV